MSWYFSKIPSKVCNPSKILTGIQLPGFNLIATKVKSGQILNKSCYYSTYL